MSERDERIRQTVAGKYRVLRLLAEGGMGAVYEAQHVLVGRRFALKFLRKDLLGRRDLVARFRHEAQTAGALENDNIAAVVDIGVATDGAPSVGGADSASPEMVASGDGDAADSGSDNTGGAASAVITPDKDADLN